MRNYKVLGIVIKRVNVGEADRIIILFTPKQGKIRVLGKGLRKLNSRRAPHLEIFSYVSVFIHESRYLPYVTEASLLNGFINIRKNFRKVAIAFHLCEIVDKLLPEKEKNEELFNSLLSVIRLLDSGQSYVEIRKGVRLFVEDMLLRLGYIHSNQKFTYSQLIAEIENIIEKPLKTLRLLTKLSKE